MLFSPSCREFNSLQKNIQHFCIWSTLLSEKKLNHTISGRRKVDGQILFGARSEKPKLYLVPGVRNGKIYLVPNDSYEKMYLAVKGLTFQHYTHSTIHQRKLATILPTFNLSCQISWKYLGPLSLGHFHRRRHSVESSLNRQTEGSNE